MFIFGMITGVIIFFAGIYVGRNEDVFDKISGLMPTFGSGRSEADIKAQILRELQEEESRGEKEEIKVEE